MATKKPASIASLIRAANQGDAAAAGKLGWIYYHGEKPAQLKVVRGEARSVPDSTQDYGKAVMWLRRASEQGYVDSMHGLAICLLEGLGCQPEPEEGMRWLRKAAGQGVNSAQMHLGRILSEGQHGEAVDSPAALKWLKRAARSNESYIFVHSIDLIWKMYFYGQGVPVNYRAAKFWLAKTLREVGEEDALMAMVKIYKEGLGVKVNAKKSAFWLKRLQAF
jgi:TPR repeat protein